MFKAPSEKSTAPQNEVFYRRYFRRLLIEQTAQDPFPQSNKKANTTLSDPHVEAIYKQRLRPYIADPSFIRPDKVDYGSTANSDIGHKLHLNVRAEDVLFVAQYLKTTGYNHKYLSGGDISKGKIFTLYPGSKAVADQAALSISHDLTQVLCRPIAVDEIEYAPNISGRFVERGLLFHKDGNGLIRGIPLLYSDLDTIEKAEERGESVKAQEISRAFLRSFSELSTKYGTYFYGE